ncbi:MAG TPA: hypothetical protein DDZ41_11000 [Flavobacterium sp.]|nr:hypothetical protein [Flavobacterium sp.]
MKKIVYLLIVSITLYSCTDDVSFNSPSFQGVKDGQVWRASDARVIVNKNGAYTIEAYTQFEVVKFEISSGAVGTRIFGVSNANKVSYQTTIDGTTQSFSTGIGAGSGELKITESPAVSGKLSGTFKFIVVNSNGDKSGFTNGVIYSIPIK